MTCPNPDREPRTLLVYFRAAMVERLALTGPEHADLSDEALLDLAAVERESQTPYGAPVEIGEYLDLVNPTDLPGDRDVTCHTCGARAILVDTDAGELVGHVGDVIGRVPTRAHRALADDGRITCLPCADAETAPDAE